MIEQMVEGLVGNGNPQFPHVSVIRLCQFAGVMPLGEINLLRRSFQSTPTFNAALKGPQLPIRKLAGKPGLEIIEKSFRFKSRVVGKLFADIIPDLFKRIWSGTPSSLFLQCAW